MKSSKKYVGILLLVIIGLVLSGCTPEKARALSIAAVQFKVESLSAVDAIDLLMDKELESPPRTNSEINEEFANRILAIPTEEKNEAGEMVEVEIDSGEIEQALDPYTVKLDDDYLQKRNEFKNKLRKHYIAFADIFKDLEGGSFFAKKAVKASAPHAKDLTLQMAAFAKSINSNPPILLQYRSAITVEIEKVREDTEITEEKKKSRLIALKEEWDLIKAKELDLQRSTVEKCLKASLLGMKVSRLIDKYDKLSLKDLNFIISKVLDEAGGISGKDLSKLKLKSEDIFAKIESDPIWEDVANTVLDEINDAMVKPTVSGGSEKINTDSNNSEGTNTVSSTVSVSSESTNTDLEASSTSVPPGSND